MVDLGGIVVIGSSGVLVMLGVRRVVSCSFSRLVSRMSSEKLASFLCFGVNNGEEAAGVLG